MKILITTMCVIALTGCVVLKREANETSSLDSDIQRYIFLHLSDQGRVIETPEVEYAMEDNGSLSFPVSKDSDIPTPSVITIGGIPLENYRQESQGETLIYIDSVYFPERDTPFIFPSGGWPHWFTLTVDDAGSVVSHHAPTKM